MVQGLFPQLAGIAFQSKSELLHLDNLTEVPSKMHFSWDINRFAARIGPRFSRLIN